MRPFLVWLNEAAQLSRMHHLRKEEEAATLLNKKVCRYVNITRKWQPYYQASSLLTLIPVQELSTSCTLACRKYTLVRHACCHLTHVQAATLNLPCTHTHGRHAPYHRLHSAKYTLASYREHAVLFHSCKEACHPMRPSLRAPVASTAGLGFWIVVHQHPLLTRVLAPGRWQRPLAAHELCAHTTSANQVCAA